VPNLLSYVKRGIKRKIQVNFLNLQEIPEFLVVSPGGCGSVNLIKYLENYGKSNLYFERKYKIFGLGHIYKPSNFLYRNKIKVIIIKRDFDDIYNSIESRGFIRNSLNYFGDTLPFMYLNIFKNKKKLKKKYLSYLEKFYSNWRKYHQKLILEINYPQLYKDIDCRIKIKDFLSIKNNAFLNNFPKFEKYNKDKNFIDPSTILNKEINNLS
tara:strand:+ start:144 stop:776 length:633 start_codon:yes stop_codon:yes gene_type:complete